MQRVVLALVFVACSSPPPEVKKQPEPVQDAKKVEEPVKAPDTGAEPVKPPEPQKFADQAAVLDAMATEVAGLADTAAMVAYLGRVKGVSGISSAEVTTGAAADGFGVKLDPPIDAAELARKFAWTTPFAVSGDAQQKTFAVQLSKGEVEGSKGKRIATEFPRFGPFRVEARLVARPEGKPPKISAGASPAYDLTSYKGNVNWLFFMREG
ncbi:MAG: hypothetical protein JNL82_34040 [Myxococcales bacterium]|nr:hypothetical protein [Myxococcales bacterium]